MARTDNSKAFEKLQQVIKELTKTVSSNTGSTKENTREQEKNVETVKKSTRERKQAKKANDELTESVKKGSKAHKDHGQRVNDSNSQYGLFTKGLAVWRNRLLLASFGVNMVKRSVGFLIEENEKLLRSQQQITGVLRSTGFSAGITSTEIRKLIEEQSRLTGESEALLGNASSVLLTFTNIGTESFPRALSAAQDLQAVFGGDLRSAVVRLGKALNDPITGVTALKETGTSFTIQQRKQIKALQESGDILGAQRIILSQVEKETGKLAQRLRDTPMGQFKNVTLEVNEALRTLGAMFTTVVVQISKWDIGLFKIIRKFNEFSDNVRDYLDPMREYRASSQEVFDIQEKLNSASKEAIDLGGKNAEIVEDLLAKTRLRTEVLNHHLNKTMTAKQIEKIYGEQINSTDAFIQSAAKHQMELLLMINNILQARDTQIQKEEQYTNTVFDSLEGINQTVKVLQAKLDLEGEDLAIKLKEIELGRSLNVLELERIKEKNRLIEAIKAKIEAQKEEQEAEDEFKKGLEAGGVEGIVHHIENINLLKEHWKDFAIDSSEVMVDMFDSYHAMQDVYIERAISDINSEYAEKIKAVQGNVALTKKLEKERDAEVKKIRNEQIDRDAKMVLAKGALSIAKIFARHGGFIPSAMAEASLMAAQTAIQHQTVIAQKAAKGANFITNGAQMLMVGDNPSGREHVQVTPLDDAPINPNLGGGTNITLNMTGNVMTESFVEEDIVPAIKEALRKGGDLNHTHISPSGRTSKPNWDD